MHPEAVEMREFLVRDEKYGWRFLNEVAAAGVACRGRSISVDLAIPYDDMEEEDEWGGGRTNWWICR